MTNFSSFQPGYSVDWDQDKSVPDGLYDENFKTYFKSGDYWNTDWIL